MLGYMHPWYGCVLSLYESLPAHAWCTRVACYCCCVLSRFDSRGYGATVSAKAVPSYALQVYAHPRGAPVLLDTVVYSLVWLLSQVYKAAVPGTAMPFHSVIVQVHLHGLPVLLDSSVCTHSGC